MIFLAIIFLFVIVMLLVDASQTGVSRRRDAQRRHHRQLRDIEHEALRSVQRIHQTAAGARDELARQYGRRGSGRP